MIGVILAARQLGPEFPVFRSCAVGGFDEHRMMLAANLAEAVAQGVEEVVVGVENLALGIEFDHRLISC